MPTPEPGLSCARQFFLETQNCVRSSLQCRYDLMNSGLLEKQRSEIVVKSARIPCARDFWRNRRLLCQLWTDRWSGEGGHSPKSREFFRSAQSSRGHRIHQGTPDRALQQRLAPRCLGSSPGGFILRTRAVAHFFHQPYQAMMSVTTSP
jgi:hypothetical protein